MKRKTAKFKSLRVFPEDAKRYQIKYFFTRIHISKNRVMFTQEENLKFLKYAPFGIRGVKT